MPSPSPSCLLKLLIIWFEGYLSSPPLIPSPLASGLLETCTGLGHGEALVLLPSVVDKFMPLSGPEDNIRGTSVATLSLSFSFSSRSTPHTAMMHLEQGIILVTRRLPCTVMASSPGNQSVISVSMCSTVMATSRAADWMLVSETDFTLKPINFDPSRRSVKRNKYC